MRRVVITSLGMSAICAVMANLLDLSKSGTHDLIAPFLVLAVLIILWPEMGEDARARLRQLRRR